MVARVAGNIGTGCARDLSIVKNIQLAWEMLAWTLDKKGKKRRKINSVKTKKTIDADIFSDIVSPVIAMDSPSQPLST
jgi:hypothetical protein